MTKCFKYRSRLAERAFTLIELLVVVAIIGLLVGILIPSVSTAIKQARSARTRARVAELAGGCNMYHTDCEYYPGQAYPGRLDGDGGPYTGSQWLARTLFGDFNNSGVDADKRYPRSKYAPVKPDDDLIDPEHPETITITGEGDYAFNFGTISDLDPRAPMAILYYPARVGTSGLGQYKMGDNSDYKSKGETTNIEWKSSQGDGTNQAAFENYIKDRRFEGNDSTTPYNSGAFLIIAAGIDRAYGTDDDIRYGW